MPILGGQLDLPRCPHCGVARPTQSQIAQGASNDFAQTKQVHWATYRCATCGSWVIAVAPSYNTEITASYPSPPKVDEDLPPRARAYLQQALDSLHAPAGAIMLAASAVDAMLKDKQYVKGTLRERIDKAGKDGLITPEMADWAHNVRLGANNQRHADEEADLPTDADARRTIEFAQAFGQFLCVLPTRIARGKADAEAAKVGN